MTVAPNTRNSLIARLSDITDHDAWREFATLYDPFIYRQARRYGLQHADARETVQEILIAVSKAVCKFEVSPDRGRFRTWLYAVGRNVCLQYLSRLRSRERSGENTELAALLAAVPSPDPLESRELELELQRHMFVAISQQIRSEFQPKTWTAFWQTAVENHSVQVVADGLTMSVGSVYVARSRVMARLKQRVQDAMLEDEVEVIELLKKMEPA